LIADTVYRYPIGQTVFSTTNELELRDGALKPCRDKPTREELLSYYVRFALEQNLRINTEETVLRIEQLKPEGFLQTRAVYNASRVLVATGAMARRRRLNAPGEELAKVHHRFDEAYPYVRKEALVVGGGNSAAEAALFLAQEGARTTLAIWRAEWENRDPKKMRSNLGCARARSGTEARESTTRLLHRSLEITERNVKLKMDDGATLVLPNDVAFILIGADADFSLLRELGVEIVQSGLTQIPVYDPETFETLVRGLYVTGHFTHARHIKEAIAIPRRIVPLIAQSLRATV
jgi:thioredoxin reductase (NADPH)